jgi:hypothetical protein
VIARALRARALVASIAFVSSASSPAFGSDRIGPGVISAFVRDAAGHPIAGALVVAEGPASRSATTSIAGIVTLLGLPIGNYDVRITHAGYTPYTKQIAVSSDPTASVLRVSVSRSSLALGQQTGSAIDNVTLGADVDTLAAHVVETTPGAQLTSVRGLGAGVAPTLLGTSVGETRVELDGIPIAGGASSYAALRFRNTIGLDGVAFEEGPVVSTPSVRDAIGGIIDYRTPDFRALSETLGDFGYSSTFGAFQHVSTTDTFGRLGIVADAVTGGGENRTQTLKARLALSSATSFDLATYGSQSSTTVAGTDVATVAPAYALGMRTSLGGASVQVRAFGSEVSSSSVLAAAFSPANEDARTHGVQGEIDVPLGVDSLALTFDRRTDAAAYLGTTASTSVAQTFTSLGARTDLRLSKDTRLELGDEYAGGTSLAQRSDPHVAFNYEPSQHLTIRGSIGSSYATAPLSVVAVQPGGTGALQPETAFGYRVGFDDDLDGIDRISAAVFDLRQYDRFATYADARTLGVDLGFTRTPRSAGLGGDVSLTFQRAAAFGSLQAGDRIATELSDLSLAQLEGDPYTTIHTHLSYRTSNGIALGIGGTLLGANNALTTHAAGFVDVTGVVTIAKFEQLRIGENNVLGTHVDDTLLAPYYAPREFTVVYRLGMGQ